MHDWGVQGSGQMGELWGRRRRRRRRRHRPHATPGDPPATPRDINIGANMDRTIHYFQDRTDIWIVRSTISRIGLSMDRTIHYFQDRTEYGSYDPLFSNISRIIDNVADLNFQYFQAGNN